MFSIDLEALKVEVQIMIDELLVLSKEYQDQGKDYEAFECMKRALKIKQAFYSNNKVIS